MDNGARVDYGKVHSQKNNHERYGRDFSSCPLVKESKDLVLLGHSFGGATVRLFSELMANGDGDHMWLQGGLVHKHDIRAFYLDLLKMIEKLK